jgi:hypothetical protein
LGQDNNSANRKGWDETIRPAAFFPLKLPHFSSAKQELIIITQISIFLVTMNKNENEIRITHYVRYIQND